MKIAIRFGHTILKNGLNTSAPGIKREYDVIRAYGPYVIQGLIMQGHEVLNVTPPIKSYSTEIQDINAGIKAANEWKADLFMSLHANSADDPEAHGCEVWYCPGNNKGQVLATNICNEIEQLGYKNRGAKEDVRGLNEIHKTNMTAVIVEPLFVGNQNDVNRFNAKEVGYSIVKGITGKEVEQEHKAKYNINFCLAFQKWYNQFTNAKLVEDGICGPNTEKALEKMSLIIRDFK